MRVPHVVVVVVGVAGVAADDPALLLLLLCLFLGRVEPSARARMPSGSPHSSSQLRESVCTLKLGTVAPLLQILTIMITMRRMTRS